MWRRRRRRRSSRRADGIPQFKPIRLSLQNVSELLSVVGAHANVRKVTKDSRMKEGEVCGWLGSGDVTSVLKFTDDLLLRNDFIPLNKYDYGEISMALVNLISDIPDVLPCFVNELHVQLDTNNEKLLIEAAFAQHFIFTKEGAPQEKGSNQSALLSNEPSNIFCFVRREDSVFLLYKDSCRDATEYFARSVWQTVDGVVFADFQSLLNDDCFKRSNGRLFAVLKDRKLQIAAELQELRNDYMQRFGSYEADKSLSSEDWGEISSLNATISEAESFELELDEQDVKQDLSTTRNIVNLSTTMSEERFNLFQRIKSKERELWKEQESFKYALIPGTDVEEARVRFHEMLPDVIENERRATRKKAKSLTALRTSTKYNVTGSSLKRKTT